MPPETDSKAQYRAKLAVPTARQRMFDAHARDLVHLRHGFSANKPRGLRSEEAFEVNLGIQASTLPSRTTCKRSFAIRRSNLPMYSGLHHRPELPCIKCKRGKGQEPRRV